MRAEVRCRGLLAGWLERLPNGFFRFSYQEIYLADRSLPAVSFTLPKSAAVHEPDGLHPFFFNLLPEGPDRLTLCRLFGIDPDDDFALLIRIARHDAIGAVTVAPETGKKQSSPSIGEIFI